MAEWTTILGPETLGDGTYANQADKTFRMVINASLLSESGHQVRLSFSRDHGSDVVIGECWIGHNSGVAGDYTFDGNQKQITFDGGNAGTTITADGQQSDGVFFDLDASKHLVIAVYISTSSSVPRKSDANHLFKYKSGNDASTQAATGYSSVNNYLVIVEEIEVVEGAISLLDFSAGITADHEDRATAESATLGMSVEATRETDRAISAGASVGLSAGRYLEVYRTAALSGAVDLDVDALNWSEWLRDNRHLAVPRYYLTLTGDADGETDLEIPIKSFQMRLRTGDPSYLECVVPDVTTYLAAINARINGDLKLEMAWILSGVESVRETLVIVDLDDARTDQGPRQESITLTGSRTNTPSTKTTYLQDVTYRSLTNGKLHIRTAVPDIYLQPGDTAKYETDDFSDSFTVERITYIVAANRQQMDVVEG